LGQRKERGLSCLVDVGGWGESDGTGGPWSKTKGRAQADLKNIAGRTWGRSRMALEVRYDTENVPALFEGGSWIQRHGAVRRQACCLRRLRSRCGRSNLVAEEECPKNGLRGVTRLQTGSVRLTWWLEGRVEGVTFGSWTSQGNEPHCLECLPR
jgi:hypothetical protein